MLLLGTAHDDEIVRRFAERIAAEVRCRMQAKNGQSLMLVAEPRMLGHLRQKLPAFIRELIAGEAAKDLTKLPTDKLRDAILAIGIDGLHFNR